MDSLAPPADGPPLDWAAVSVTVRLARGGALPPPTALNLTISWFALHPLDNHCR